MASNSQRVWGKIRVELWYEDPLCPCIMCASFNLWRPQIAVWLSCGQSIYRPDERGSPSPWMEKAALQTWSSICLWKLLVNPSFPWSKTHGYLCQDFLWQASRAKGGGVCNCIWFSMCLSSIPEWPPVLLALLTWLFYFWIEELHLILQSESWFHITDTFV